MKKVLVIEDELDIIAVVTIILENEGYHVASVSRVEGYQQLVREHAADVVLLDLNLAGFNGGTICQYIKSDSQLMHTPVLLMSANNNIHEVMERYGANDLILKPFDLHSLIEKVNHYT